MRDAWLGLDLGTQSARALAVDETGRILGRGAQPLAGHRDGPRHEQDPSDWWPALAGACRDAMETVAPEALRGLSLCATSGTILLTDGSGHPLTPGVMYDDTRAGDVTARVQEAGEEVWNRLGYRMQASWALPKLVWLLREHGRPEAGTRLAHQPDVITRRLVGHAVASDTSHALKTGYDLLRDRWPADVFEALEIPVTLLPDVVRPAASLGSVCAEAAGETGIPEGTPVIAGMTDGCAAQLGAGALSTGSWNAVLGTTLVLKGVSEDLLHDPLGVVYSHRGPRNDWLPGGASSVGAGILSAEYPDRDLDELGGRAAEREPAGVLAYPLAGQGERFPFQAPDAEGFVLGEPADEADHYAALLQGVAYVTRLCFDYLDLIGAPVDGQLSMTGGGTASRYWCQLQADVLGRPLRLPANAEGTLGMAVLAASSQRALTDVAADMVVVREVVEPRPDRVDRFHEPYLRLVGELASRGWLDERAAGHARQRAG